MVAFYLSVFAIVNAHLLLASQAVTGLNKTTEAKFSVPIDCRITVG